MKYHQTKELILNQLIEQLDNKIESIKKYIDSAKESRDNETKSSVGDKYETGRAMAQMEMEKNQVQLNNILNQKNELLKIDSSKEFNQADFGAIIITDRGNYFLSIGIGKVDIKNESWFCISISSPIGKFLHNKKKGDSFQFQGREFEVNAIY